MTLKWASAILAAASAGSFTTANVLLGTRVPVAVNLALAAVATGGVVLVVVAELYQRLDSRLGVLSEFLVARLDEIAGRLDALEVEGMLADRGDRESVPSTVVPLAPRRTRR
jgi:hypothetical protein